MVFLIYNFVGAYCAAKVVTRKCNDDLDRLFKLSRRQPIRPAQFLNYRTTPQNLDSTLQSLITSTHLHHNHQHTRNGAPHDLIARCPPQRLSLPPCQLAMSLYIDVGPTGDRNVGRACHDVFRQPVPWRGQREGKHQDPGF